MHAVEVPFESRLRFASVEEAVIERHRATLRSEATRKLHALAARAGVDAGRWTPLALDGRSSPWPHIVQQEQEQDCDLIVIGKHGRNALEELLLGSTTSMVIAETSSDGSCARAATHDERLQRVSRARRDLVDSSDGRIATRR